MDKKALMGIGTLIIFIMTMMVCLTAAVTLILDSSMLVQDALQVKEDVKNKASLFFKVIDVYGEDGYDGRIENLTMLGKLMTGTEPFYLNYTVVVLYFSNETHSIAFSDRASNTTFSVDFLVNNSVHSDKLVGYGEVVRFNFVLPRSVGSGEELTVFFSAKEGLAMRLELVIPRIVGMKRIQIYPG